MIDYKFLDQAQEEELIAEALVLLSDRAVSLARLRAIAGYLHTVCLISDVSGLAASTSAESVRRALEGARVALDGLTGEHATISVRALRDEIRRRLMAVEP